MAVPNTIRLSKLLIIEYRQDLPVQLEYRMLRFFKRLRPAKFRYERGKIDMVIIQGLADDRAVETL